MNASSQEPTQTQEALSVLLCGGLAGVATWVSIFPLGIIPPMLHADCPTNLLNLGRRDQDPPADI
jgi:hypothetical protein